MDRITNESNLWLNAIKMEDEGSYLKAFVFYLKDSSECIKQNSFVRAALSCSCAADCLAMGWQPGGGKTTIPTDWRLVRGQCGTRDRKLCQGGTLVIPRSLRVL